MANEVETLIFKAQTSELAKARKDLNKLEKAANDAGDATENTSKKQKGFGKMLMANKGKIAAVAAALVVMAHKINEVLKATEEAGSKFSILNARLVTATGSTEGAALAFQELNKFALQTPFTLDESVNGFAKLVNLGLNPSKESMISFANTSAAMGTSLEQMIEAVADATTMEFERLKEFGIKTKQEGDKVQFTFRGITTEVGKNADEVKEFLENIGNTTFAGAAIEQTRTLAGSISNLDQAYGLLAIAAGEVAGANDIFAQSNNDLAAAISDPEYQEGVAKITTLFANMKATVVSAIQGVKGALVDLVTTTTTEELDNVNSKISTLTEQLAQAEKMNVTFTLFGKEMSTRGGDIENMTERLKELNAEKAILEGKQVEVGQAEAPEGEGATLSDAVEKKTPEQIAAEAEAARVKAVADAKAALEQSITDAETTVAERLSAIDINSFLNAGDEQSGSIFDQMLFGLEGVDSATSKTLENMQTGFAMIQEANNMFDEEKDAKLLEKIELERERDIALAEEEFLKLQTHHGIIEGMEEKHKKNIAKINKKANDSKDKVEDKGRIASLKKNIKFLGGLATAFGGGSEKMFKISKALNIGETIMDTAKGITKAVSEQNYGQAAKVAATGAMQLATIKSQQFSSGGGGGSAPSAGGGMSGAGGASSASTQPMEEFVDAREAERVVNVSINNAIDPAGARQIVEALNDATEDGLEINALVG